MNNLDYGVIGNCKSAALISKSGSLEWCCLPDFNSSSVFAKILDREKGGEFGFEVTADYNIKQKYLYKTNILSTEFSNGKDVFEVIDFMPRYKTGKGYHCPPDLIRYIRPIAGKPKMKILYNPKLGYAQYETKNIIENAYIKSLTTGGVYESIYLYSNIDLKKILHKEEVEIKDDSYFLLSYNQKLLDLNTDKINLEYEKTKVYWLEWVDRTVHFSKYYGHIIRSALVLKLLTYQKSGAILAAVTTSLPETLHEVRNWDYRFCWIRDASMIIRILTDLEHYNAAERFLNFIVSIISYKDENVQIMYGIRGEKNLTEKKIDWLCGFEGSKPIRVGNAAYLQKQNDIYGVLLDVIYEYFYLFRNSLDNSEDLWTIVRSLVRTVEKNWKKPDTSIWEYRTQKKHFVFSKVLCWVAFDRAVKIARLLRKPSLASQWACTRDSIKEEVLKKGWNEKVKAFTQSYKSDDMDAANLLMATYGFIDYRDPKYVMTVRKIQKELCMEDLMYRYKNKDDFGKPQSSFTVCTFWMIKSLYKIGEKKEAKKMFEKLLQYSNHLNLFSEDIDFKTKRLLGNFPQGYSHLALIDVAITLSGQEIGEEDKMLHDLEYRH